MDLQQRFKRSPFQCFSRFQEFTLPRKVHRSVGQICNEKSFYFLKQFSQRVANKNSIFPMTLDIQFYYKKGIRSIPFLTFEINLGEVDKKSGFLPPKDFQRGVPTWMSSEPNPLILGGDIIFELVRCLRVLQSPSYSTNMDYALHLRDSRSINQVTKKKRAKNIFSSWRKLIFQKKKIENRKSQNFQIFDKNRNFPDFQKSSNFRNFLLFCKSEFCDFGFCLFF